MSNEKAMIILSIVGLIKKTIKKADLKNATGVDTSKLVAKSDLAGLKVEIDKIDVDKLKRVPAALSKLSMMILLKKLCVRK